MTTDLGTMQININELGGGAVRAGAGPTIPGRGKVAEEAIAGALNKGFLQRFGDRVNTAGGIKEELAGFLRNPGVDTARGLVDPASKVGSALGTMGKAGRVASGAILGLGAAAGAVGVVMGSLEAILSLTEARIGRTWRYSGDATAAMTRQKIQDLNDALVEASRNGLVYADVIDAGTFSASTYNEMMGNLTASASGLAMAWSYLKGALWKFISLLALPSATLARAGASFKQWAVPKISDFMDGLRIFTQSMPGMSWLRDIWQWVRAILEDLHILAKRTAGTAGANKWMMEDLQAITGKAY